MSSCWVQGIYLYYLLYECMFLSVKLIMRMFLMWKPVSFSVKMFNKAVTFLNYLI